MEVIILLKLKIDSEQFKKQNETDDDIKTKMRAYIANVVGYNVEKQEHIELISSSVAAEIEPEGTVQIQPSNTVVRLPDPDIKIQ